MSRKNLKIGQVIGYMRDKWKAIKHFETFVLGRIMIPLTNKGNKLGDAEFRES